MVFNPLIFALTALVPTIVGFVYYNPKVMGGVWERHNNFKEGDAMPSMAVTIGLSIVLGFFMSVSLNFIVIHSNGLFSMLANSEAELKDTTTGLGKTVADLMAAHGGNFRTFGHGALHGVLTALFFVFPMITTTALWERKSWAYIGVHVMYWTICLAIMGGIICQFSGSPSLL